MGNNIFNMGDRKYIDSLPKNLRDLGEALLISIRKIVPNGELEYLSKKRSFKEKINYYTLKPQKTVNNIFITVHGRPYKFKRYYNILDFKEDRPGYSCFRINNLSQIDSTIDIIRQAIANKGI